MIFSRSNKKKQAVGNTKENNASWLIADNMAIRHKLIDPKTITDLMVEANSHHLTFEKWYRAIYYLATVPDKRRTRLGMANRIGVSPVTFDKMKHYIIGGNNEYRINELRTK